MWAISDLTMCAHLRPASVHSGVLGVSPSCPPVRPCIVPGRSQMSEVRCQKAEGCLSFTLLEILRDSVSLHGKQTRTIYRDPEAKTNGQ